MPWAGGQVRLAARNHRRRDLVGIIEWRLAELDRMGVEVRYDTFADASLVQSLDPSVVIVATGGLPQLPPDVEGADLLVSSWEILGGDVKPAAEVLLFDDDGSHSAMSAAEVIAASGARLELVTPERTVGVDVGGMNLVPYARALNEADARIILNQRVRSVARRTDGRFSVILGSEHTPVTHERVVDQVVADHGVLSNDELYLELRSASRNDGEVDHTALIEGRPQAIVRRPDATFQLFRIGDAVAGRNIHAAIYDALRLCKDL
jgi:hypothetical protein